MLLSAISSGHETEDSSLELWEASEVGAEELAKELSGEPTVEQIRLLASKILKESKRLTQERIKELAKEVIQETSMKSKEEPKEKLKEKLTLKITYDRQDIFPDGRQKVVIWVENDTDFRYKGKIFFYAKDYRGVSIERAAFLYNIPPGKASWNIFWLTKWQEVSKIVNDVDGEFYEVKSEQSMKKGLPNSCLIERFINMDADTFKVGDRYYRIDLEDIKRWKKESPSGFKYLMENLLDNPEESVFEELKDYLIEVKKE